MYDNIINAVTMLSNLRGESPTKSMKDSGVGKDFFYNLRKGAKPSVDKIEALASYFSVSTDVILGREEIVTQGITLNDFDIAVLQETADIKGEREREKFLQNARHFKDLISNDKKDK